LAVTMPLSCMALPSTPDHEPRKPTSTRFADALRDDQYPPAERTLYRPGNAAPPSPERPFSGAPPAPSLPPQGAVVRCALLALRPGRRTVPAPPGGSLGTGDPADFGTLPRRWRQPRTGRRLTVACSMYFLVSDGIGIRWRIPCCGRLMLK
jgi:hypothetical protein